ncbi:MAG: hypothetical protein AAGI34_15095 [Pseudomonadota bacterium]
MIENPTQAHPIGEPPREPQSTHARHRIEALTDEIRLPLENIEFTLEQYLLENGCRLDLETRLLLARLRDSLGAVAQSSRRMVEAERQRTPKAGSRAQKWPRSAA